jgi:hypothetical protein
MKGGNMEAATEWIFAHPEVGESMDVEAQAAVGTGEGSLSKTDFLDGSPSELAYHQFSQNQSQYFN